MGDDTEWMKLPTEDKVQHKVWKARVAGYEEAIKLFQRTTDPKSPEFSKYAGLLKKFVADNNAVAQEKALDAVVAFVENAALGPKTCGEVMAALLSKCINASKQKTRDKTFELIMLYIEVDKPDIVQEALLGGLENKQPKVVVGCIQALTMALRDFGFKVIQIKPILKVLPKLLEDRDKNVRDEAKLLVIEVYRWIGAAIKPQMTNFKPVQVQELEAEFEKLPPGKPLQSRFMRSQQDLKAKMEEQAMAAAASGEQEAEEGEAAQEEIDPYELMSSVDILAQIPKDFYDKVEAKKWQERKEALEQLQKLTESPKIENGDFGPIIKVLIKVVGKDTNVMIVAVGGKCMAGIAKGLRKKFAPYALQCVQVILEKFKEKKPMVVQALREAIDAIYPSTNLEAIMEDVVAALDNKNPSIKAETAAFLTRCFARCTTATLPKKLLKAYVTALLKTVNDTAGEVREPSFDALGMAMKVVTEKNISPFLVDLDPIKMQKIQESCQKSVLLNARGEPRGGGAAAAAPPASQPKPVQRPPTAKPPPKPAENSSSNAVPPEAGGPPRLSAQSKAVKGGKKAGAKKGAAGKKGGSGDADISENALSDEAVEEKMQALLPGDCLTGLDSSNWKERLASCEKVLEVLKRSSKEDIPCQACVRTLNKKPGLKDTNFQVLKLRLDAVAYLAENAKFTRRSAEFCLTDLVDKVGDPKNSAGAQAALTAIAEAVGFEFVSSEVVRYAFEQKNPKNQSEALNWLSQAIKEFGFKVNIKPMIGNLKTALAATNPTVRSSAISVLATAYMYMGATLRVFFEDEKPALLQQIDAEFEKVKGEKPPAPTRGAAPKGDAGDDDEEDKEEEEDSATTNVQDLLPRVDISEKITEGLLTELSDKNWKVRNEALSKVAAIISEAKFVTANIGQLAEALKTRLADSNKILVTTSIGLCQSLAAALGPHCKAHIKTIGPALLSCLGDTKPQVRAAAVAALNAWVEPCSLLPLVECEALPDILKVETPVLRAEVLGWLTEKLPGHKQLPNELRLCVPFVLACLEDRNADVRKKAQEALVPFMIHTGFDAFAKGASKVKPASKDQIMGILEKARENLPAKPQKTKKAAAAPPPSAQSAPPPASAPKSAPPPDRDEEKPPARTPSETRASKTVKGRKSTAAPAASSKKKGEEEDTGPLMTMTVSKEQRVKDEKAMKVLKWNFLEVRPEFVEQLRTQMERNFSKTMMDMLFHRDFKFHTKAIENLMKCIEALPDETLCNLDLILKWLTLRFFDTNPSMLNKALEYLQQLFTTLSAQDFHLSDLEASSFIPYLVIKVGENKDNVRREVRNIFKLICQIYPGSKMFTFLLDGLKSKNSKQRAECLEELGCLIELYGITVCQPSPAQALKTISQQIGDRDTGVRNSALNTMVVAHGILQDNLFKYTGHLNDKDMSLLEERLKRAAKNKPPPKPVQEEQRPKTAPQRPTSHPSAQTARPQTALPKSASANSMKQPGEFTLDIDLEPAAPAELPPLIQHDLEFLYEPVTMPTLKTRPQSPAAKLVGSGEASTTVGYVISQVTSADIPSCIQALAQIDEVLKEERRAEVLAPQVDQLLLTIVMQFKMASSTHLSSETVSPGDVISLHRCLLSTLVAVFEHGSLATRVSRDVLREVFSALISLLLDARLSDMSEEGPQIIRSVNIVFIKIINCADHTNATSALIRLLQDCVGSETCSAKYLDLVMKCLWRIVKMLPDIVKDLKLERLLLDCHLFLRAFPPSSWRNRPSDTPLRTIKTFLNSLAKLMGAKILNYMGMIEATENSEVDAYLRKLLRNDVASTNARNEELSFDTPVKSASKSKSLSGSTHDTLTEIFKKIGSKEKTKEGLNDLYDFTQAHPEANLEPFLKKSSQFFQSYIDRSLRSIKLEREGKAADPAIPESEMPTAEKDFKGVEYYRERLRNIRAKCGLDAEEQEKPPSPQILKMSDSDSRRSSSTESVPDVTSGILTELKSDNRPAPAQDKKSNVELSDLKMRLERIKKLAKT